MGAPSGPTIDPAMAKIFGDNSAFSADMEMQTVDRGDNITMPGKISYDAGKSRFEMDMSQLKSGKVTPQQTAQMKVMGMDRMVTINRPDKKVSYLIYPGLEAYAETEVKETEKAKASDKAKVETTELAKESIDGHACVKNKVVVTDDNGAKHEYTVWNATDLKNFPVKVETTERDNKVTMLYKNVKLSKPDSTSFDVPESFKRYDSMSAMVQGEMMKRMGRPGGLTPPSRN